MKRTPHIPVAIFLSACDPDGNERQLIELIRRLDRSRFDVHVACFRRKGASLAAVEACAPVTQFPVRGLARASLFSEAAAFAHWCRARRIAVLHTCGTRANAVGLPAAAMVGVPIRIGSRDVRGDSTRARAAMERLAYRCATLVVAPSRAAAQALAAAGLPRTQIEVIPNGIAIENYPARPRSGDIRIVLTLAHPHKKDGHEVLFAAAAHLLPRYPDVRLQIVGDGPREAELRDRAVALGIGGHVDFLGRRDDVPALLAAADVVVLPSAAASVPERAIEAMAAGLPVVAWRAESLLEVIEDGRSGRLVAPDDPMALAGALESLMRSPRLAIELGRGARERIARQYSFDRTVQAFEHLYLSCVLAAGVSASRAAAA